MKNLQEAVQDKRADEANRSTIGQIEPKVARISNATIVIGQLLVILVAAIVYTTLQWMSSSYAFIVTMTTIVVIEVVTAMIVKNLLAYPLDVLTRSVSSIIGEKPSVYPPNPNSTHGPVKVELSKAINFLYTSEAANGSGAGNLSSDAGQVAINLVHSLPVGLIALDYNFHILAFNDNAPVLQAGDRQVIQLDFRSNNQSLKQWFDSVKDQSITASQTWTRIQNVPSGSLEPRHVYDVVASYRQHAVDGISLIVVTVDRTADYVDSEENIDFVALAAHELRGPVTVIRGYLDMLDEQIYDKATKDQQALLDRLNVSAKRLTSYVNNVLNANRYDRNNLQLKLAKITLPEIISDIQRDLDLRASTVGRNVEWNIPDGLPPIAADRSCVGEVITNLVDNAIKYSGKGEAIQVTARQSGNFVAVSVIDHGIGISRSAIEHLFTKFYRSRRSSASIGGTGIGLYISRAIVESHGGNISVSSTEGKGSTFTFTIPTYESVKDKLDQDGNADPSLINRNNGWIDNHGSITK